MPEGLTFAALLEQMLQILVGGFTTVAEGMGTGISTLVSNLLFSGTTLSPFMGVVLIFGAVALALGLCRWVVNLLGSFGQRNR